MKIIPMIKKLSITLVSASVFLTSINSACAQSLGDLFNALKSIQVPAQSSAVPATAPNVKQGSGVVQNQSNFGGKITENYCKSLFAIASIEKRGVINENLITEEFNIPPSDFFDVAFEAFKTKQGYASYTFPSPTFYQNEFETDKINVLFNLLLSYPSPKYMAALISESRTTPNMPQYDDQAKVDAKAALAIIHFRLQDRSSIPTRWKELSAELRREDHYLAKVISARLLSSGELGPVDISNSIFVASEANSIRSRRGGPQNSGQWSLSSRNYQITSNLTLYEILASNPNNQYTRNYAQFFQIYQKSLKQTVSFPEVKNQLEPSILLIERASRLAAQKGQKMVDVAKESGNLIAQKASLDSGLRNRLTDNTEINADIQTMAAISRQMEKGNLKLTAAQGPDLDQALAYLHESGDRAIALMPTMLNVMLNVSSQHGMEYLPTLIPYGKKLQSYSDAACTVTAQLDRMQMIMKSGKADSNTTGLQDLMKSK